MRVDLHLSQSTQRGHPFQLFATPDHGYLITNLEVEGDDVELYRALTRPEVRPSPPFAKAVEGVRLFPPFDKPIAIPAGTSNGLLIKNLIAKAGPAIHVGFDVDELTARS